MTTLSKMTATATFNNSHINNSLINNSLINNISRTNYIDNKHNFIKDNNISSYSNYFTSVRSNSNNNNKSNNEDEMKI